MYANLEKYTPISISLFIGVLSLLFKWNLSELNDYKFLFSNIVAVISILFGVLITILFQLLSYKNTKIVILLKKLGVYKYLTKYSIIATASCIVTISLSIILAIYFDTQNVQFALILTTIYNFILVFCIGSILRVIILFLKLSHYADQVDNYSNEKVKSKKHPSNKFKFED